VPRALSVSESTPQSCSSISRSRSTRAPSTTTESSSSRSALSSIARQSSGCDAQTCGRVALAVGLEAGEEAGTAEVAEVAEAAVEEAEVAVAMVEVARGAGAGAGVEGAMAAVEVAGLAACEWRRQPYAASIVKTYTSMPESVARSGAHAVARRRPRKQMVTAP
jgi:hypothetical protein